MPKWIPSATKKTTAADWNARFPVGTKVRYFPVMGDVDHEDTVTRSDAWETPDKRVVAKIEGRAGFVLAEHLAVEQP